MSFLKLYCEIPEKPYIKERMRALALCSENLIDRRSSSVRGWLLWIRDLISV